MRPLRQDVELSRAQASVFPKKVGAAGGTDVPSQVALSVGSVRRAILAQVHVSLRGHGRKSCVCTGGEGACVSQAPHVLWVGCLFCIQAPSKSSAHSASFNPLIRGFHGPANTFILILIPKMLGQKLSEATRAAGSVLWFCECMGAGILPSSETRGARLCSDASALLRTFLLSERCLDVRRSHCPRSQSLHRRKGPGLSPATHLQSPALLAGGHAGLGSEKL